MDGITDDIREFIHSEVTRQGFKPLTEQHRVRCLWMENAWRAAQSMSKIYFNLTVEAVRLIGALIEPRNIHGYRKCGVRVGDWRAPACRSVPKLMKKWEEAITGLSPDEAYYEFEMIHPFVDGNGRTGKILHNWLNKTLDKPVLVRDFFGHGVP